MPYMEKAEEIKEVSPIVLTSENQKDRLKEITDRLEQGILEVFESERYKEYLRVMSKFHHYSFNNTMLIALQKPDASLIAGFSAWKNTHGRTVKKGEKGIRIIAPAPFKVKQEMEKLDPKTNMPLVGADGNAITEEKEITIPAYKVVSVFDVSQTEGKELPSIGVDELTGDVSQYEDFFTALKKASPVPIALEHIEGSAHGYYHLAEKRIAIDDNMSELQTLKTAIHEIAHAKLHDIDLNAPKEEKENHPNQRTREVEAESVAYSVCRHYGLDTSDYSFDVRFVVSALSDTLRIKKKHPKIMMNKTNNMPTDLPMLPFVFLLNLFSIKAFFALPVNPVYSTRDPGNSPAGHRINSFRYGFVFIATQIGRASCRERV